MKNGMYILLVIFLPVTLSVLAENGSPPQRRGFENFQVIWERNIFNPNRRSGIKNVPSFEPPETAPIEQIRLVGVLIQEGKALAFFEGSNAAWNGEWKTGDMIAGFTIREIRTHGVILYNEKSEIDLPVGSAMVKKDAPSWEISSAPMHYEKPRQSETKLSGHEKKDDQTSDILKKLMERRKQEMSP